MDFLYDQYMRAVLAGIFLCSCCNLLFAQQPSTTPGSSSSSHSQIRKGAPDSGSILKDGYRNNFFQFSYQVPFGWVDRTSEMADDVETGKSKVLLAIFERPPAAPGNTVNSAVIIAVESAGYYPGLKAAADYFGPLTEVAQSKGFKVVNDPYEFPVDAKPIVRRDFIKESGNLTTHQSSLVMLSKGYLLSVTFIAGSDDDVVELIEKLRFGGKAR